MHRPYLVGAATGLFALVALASTPAMATPCTNLASLNLEHTAITGAADITTGTFTPPGWRPDQRFASILPRYRDACAHG
jgi:feruloyl esterase